MLFIGAHHGLTPRLQEDIGVEMVKDPRRARAYFEALLSAQDDRRLSDPARSLCAPVEAS